MNKEPLARKEAEQLALSNQDLVGQNYSQNATSSYRIEFITLAPYDDINQYIFIKQYESGATLSQALEDYNGQLFDVIVITHIDSEKAGLAFRSLQEYLWEKKKYSSPPQKN